MCPLDASPPEIFSYYHICLSVRFNAFLMLSIIAMYRFVNADINYTSAVESNFPSAVFSATDTFLITEQ